MTKVQELVKKLQDNGVQEFHCSFDPTKSINWIWGVTWRPGMKDIPGLCEEDAAAILDGYDQPDLPDPEVLGPRSI